MLRTLYHLVYLSPVSIISSSVWSSSHCFGFSGSSPKWYNGLWWKWKYPFVFLSIPFSQGPLCTLWGLLWGHSSTLWGSPSSLWDPSSSVRGSPSSLWGPFQLPLISSAPSEALPNPRNTSLLPCHTLLAPSKVLPAPSRPSMLIMAPFWLEGLLGASDRAGRVSDRIGRASDGIGRVSEVAKEGAGRASKLGGP